MTPIIKIITQFGDSAMVRATNHIVPLNLQNVRNSALLILDQKKPGTQLSITKPPTLLQLSLVVIPGLVRNLLQELDPETFSLRPAVVATGYYGGVG